jgi:hypothetical protein
MVMLLVPNFFIALTAESNVLNSFQHNYATIAVTSVKLLGNMLLMMLLMTIFL